MLLRNDLIDHASIFRKEIATEPTAGLYVMVRGRPEEEVMADMIASRATSVLAIIASRIVKNLRSSRTANLSIKWRE